MKQNYIIVPIIILNHASSNIRRSPILNMICLCTYDIEEIGCRCHANNGGAAGYSYLVVGQTLTSRSNMTHIRSLLLIKKSTSLLFTSINYTKQSNKRKKTAHHSQYVKKTQSNGRNAIPLLQ